MSEIFWWPFTLNLSMLRPAWIIFGQQTYKQRLLSLSLSGPSIRNIFHANAKKRQQNLSSQWKPFKWKCKQTLAHNPAPNTRCETSIFAKKSLPPEKRPRLVRKCQPYPNDLRIFLCYNLEIPRRFQVDSISFVHIYLATFIKLDFLCVGCARGSSYMDAINFLDPVRSRQQKKLDEICEIVVCAREKEKDDFQTRNWEQLKTPRVGGGKGVVMKT